MLKLIILFILSSCSSQIASNSKGESNTISKPQDSKYDIKAILPKAKRYSQGLFLSDDSKYLYESGGLYKKSTLAKFEYPSLKKVEEIKLNETYFAEGIAKCGDFIYQLTWRERKILKYNASDMKLNATLQMPTEVNDGWGLSSSDKNDELFATNGSNSIFRLDCTNNLQVKSKISVTLKKRTVNNLNDLAYANNFIWANVYLTTLILKIDPATGEIVNDYDMKALADYEVSSNTLSYGDMNAGDVLNGICYDKVKQTFVITGKEWGHFYEVVFK